MVYTRTFQRFKGWGVVATFAQRFSVTGGVRCVVVEGGGAAQSRGLHMSAGGAARTRTAVSHPVHGSPQVYPDLQGLWVIWQGSPGHHPRRGDAGPPPAAVARHRPCAGWIPSADRPVSPDVFCARSAVPVTDNVVQATITRAALLSRPRIDNASPWPPGVADSDVPPCTCRPGVPRLPYPTRSGLSGWVTRPS